MAGRHKKSNPLLTIIIIVLIFQVLTSAIFWNMVMWVAAFFFAIKLFNSFNKFHTAESNRERVNTSSRQSEEDEEPYIEEDDFYFDLDDIPEHDALTEIIEEKVKVFN